MKSLLKSKGYSALKWFMNETGFIEHPRDTANKFLLILIVLALLIIGSSFTIFSGMMSSIVSLVGIMFLLLAFIFMIAGDLVQFASRHNSSFINSLDSRQSKLDQFTDQED